jgi:hypothetical protein
MRSPNRAATVGDQDHATRLRPKEPPTRPGRLLGSVDPHDFGDPATEISLFDGCASVADLRAVLYGRVEEDVAAMLDLVAEADAFDVIELMRLREFGPVLDPRAEMPGGWGLVIEIVAAALLSRAGRKPSAVAREDTRPHEVVEELHARAKRLGRLGLYRHKFEAELTDRPLSDLAADYQAAVLSIRNLQYDHIRDRHEARLFQNPLVEELMRRHLGYSYADALCVRGALRQISGDRMTALRDATGSFVLRYRDTPRGQVPARDIARFQQSMAEFMFLPGERAIIRASDVAATTGLDEAVAAVVLFSHSQRFDDSIHPAKRVFDLLTGTNPFLTRPLVTDSEGGFVSTVNDPGLDSLRRVFEQALVTRDADMKRYDRRARQPASEGLAIESLERILGQPASYAGFYYWAPKREAKDSDLGSQCLNLAQVADRVEGDGLFLVDDVAIVVEVKARSVATQSRRGDLRRLESDLKATIGSANDQAMRLQRLIETNRGIWLGPDRWLDLSHVREARSVVALLDDIGPLGVAIGALQAAGLVATKRPPWVASLHDLAVMSEICDRPGEFLLYLRRRTDSDVATRYRGSDELDLFMLFLDGQLYVDDDPDEVREAHPSAGPVRSVDRRGHRETARDTLVTDHCQPLTEWYSRDEVPESETPPRKPEFNVAPELVPLIDAIAARRAPGWLRCTADLLGLAGQAQEQVLAYIRECRRLASADGTCHHFVVSFAGMWGHPAVFGAVSPNAAAVPAGKHRLSEYARVKSYQMQCDRAFGLLLDTGGNLVDFVYHTDPPESDSDLDRLVAEMRLEPVGRSRKPAPPSAKRATIRLRGKKKRKKRR